MFVKSVLSCRKKLQRLAVLAKLGDCPKLRHVCEVLMLLLCFQGCHGYVTAGFNFKVDVDSNYTVLTTPSIVYQGISGKLVCCTTH